MANEELKQANMERVIQTTVSYMQTIPIHNITREMIAHKTGLSVRSLQRYFGTLDNLMFIATKRYYQAFDECFSKEFYSRNIGDKSGLEQLRFIIESFSFLLHPDMPSILTLHQIEQYWCEREPYYFYSLVPSAILSCYGLRDDHYNFLMTIFECGMQDGSIRSDLNKKLAYEWIYGAFTGLLYRIGFVNAYFQHKNSDCEPEQIISSFTDAVISYIRAK